MALVRENPGKRKARASLAKQLNVEKAKTFSSFFCSAFPKKFNDEQIYNNTSRKKYKISAWNRGRMG